MGIIDTIKTFIGFQKRCLHYIAVGNAGQIFRDIKSWWHFRHQAWRDVLTYDPEKKRYRLDRHTLIMKDINPDDLAVTGAKYHYFYTDLEPPERHEKRVEVDEEGNTHEFLNTSAVSNYLYMVNNDINDAMAGTFTNKPINPVVVGVIIVLAIVGVVLYMFMGGN